MRLLSMAAILVLAGCGDATGPDSLRVIITPVTTDGPLGTFDPTGRHWLVACDAGVTVRVTGSDDQGIRWTGASVNFTGGGSSTLTLAADEVASLFGGAVLGTAEERYASLRFSAPEPFRVTARFTYVAVGGGRERSTEYAHECIPPGGALDGAYVLRTINGVALPAASLTGVIDYDTLRFLPNMTYTMSGAATGSPPAAAGPDPYRIPLADVVELTVIGPGTVASPGSVRREPGWLTYTQTLPGRESYVWRFQRIP